MSAIRLTSMARAYIDPGAHYELEQRARALGCTGGVLWNSKHRWTASVTREGVRKATWGHATVYEALEAVLDAMEAHLDAEERDRLSDRYTGDELLTIAAQSGLEVARA